MLKLRLDITSKGVRQSKRSYLGPWPPRYFCWIVGVTCCKRRGGNGREGVGSGKEKSGRREGEERKGVVRHKCKCDIEERGGGRAPPLNPKNPWS